MLGYNRKSVIQNEYQMDIARILCVCSGGVLRSPTLAEVLNRSPYDFNTRSAGTEDYALIKVDEALLVWADGIVVMEKSHSVKVNALLDELKLKRPVEVLNIPDQFEFRSERLIQLINERLPIMLGDRIQIKRGNVTAAAGTSEEVKPVCNCNRGSRGLGLHSAYCALMIVK